MALSEEQLITWSRPVSTSEDQKCINVVSQVTEAVREQFGNSVSIFLQGSYRNNTNIKKDSDVDIVVRSDDYFFPKINGLSAADQARFHQLYPSGTYTFTQFKNEVHIALQRYFGVVQRKNKCIYVPGNTYRVNADVVPCFILKRYRSLESIDAEGIKLIADDASVVLSYPHQHYENGVSKTKATGRMYKRIVRILKRIRNELINARQIQEGLVSSFFIECLVYNVPNSYFLSGQYKQTLRNILVKLFNDMKDEAIANDYKEVSELQWLFRGSTRSPQDAKLFIQSCWNYGEFQ